MRKKLILFIMIVLGIGTGSILAQEYRYAWIDFGFGSGRIHGWGRGAVFAELTLREEQTTYSLRATRLFRPFSEARYDKAWDIGVLYGRALTPTSSRMQVSGAIGVALTEVRAEYDDVKTIGVPIEAKVSYRFSRSFGIGFYGFLNLNLKESYGGLGLTFRIGKNLNK